MNNLVVNLQQAEQRCVSALLACDETLDGEDWPAFVNQLGECRHRLVRQFDAETLLLYAEPLSNDTASMRECTELHEERERINMLAQLSSQAAFMRDTARCRSLIAQLRDSVMTHWMKAQRQMMGVGTRERRVGEERAGAAAN